MRVLPVMPVGLCAPRLQSTSPVLRISSLGVDRRRAVPGAAVSRRERWRSKAMGDAPQWTLDQIVGLAFGGLMVAFYYSAQVVDAYIARSQRRELGICEECGGINEASSCKLGTCPYKQDG
ncbi:hypothetical protein BSKO_01734 [Bryopsis sp. KO-2023]|nr:hypothetical protein BSKO_01734 [Bryopsis sp. KO-2023]